MKLAKIMPIAILCLIISVTIVSASHTSSVIFTPNSWTKNTEKTVSLTVTNANGDTITKVELMVPETAEQVPLYIIKEITTPSGWNYSLTGRTSQIYPYKITWTGSGIESGKSLTFGLAAVSPASSGDYKWNWKTYDATSSYSGFSITTVGQAPVSYFVISGAPTSSIAGNSFKVNVRAYGDDDKIKTDYTGKISFSSTDPYGMLPSDYTFQTSDYGSKDFSITYKTTGDHKLTVKDSSAGISTESAKTSVKPGPATDIGITPEDKKVSAGEKVEFKVMARDALGNVFDLTDKATLTIDKRAGGSWNKSVYTAENEGTWIAIASYNALVSGTTLTVGKTTVVTPTEKINITTTVPEEEAAEMTITVPESVSIAPGANDTMIITVNNNGDKGLTGVEVKVGGVPGDWASVYPLLNDIPAKSSKDYLIIVFVPKNESGTKTVEFTAEASEGASAAKSTDLVISSAPTGTFAMPKNVLQLGVVIIAVAAVVIIGWELWFKKPKAK